MRKVLAWVLFFGVLGVAGVGTIQWFQPTPIRVRSYSRISEYVCCLEKMQEQPKIALQSEQITLRKS